MQRIFKISIRHLQKLSLVEQKEINTYVNYGNDETQTQKPLILTRKLFWPYKLHGGAEPEVRICLNYKQRRLWRKEVNVILFDYKWHELDQVFNQTNNNDNSNNNKNPNNDNNNFFQNCSYFTKQKSLEWLEILKTLMMTWAVEDII